MSLLFYFLTIGNLIFTFQHKFVFCDVLSNCKNDVNVMARILYKLSELSSLLQEIIVRVWGTHGTASLENYSMRIYTLASIVKRITLLYQLYDSVTLRYQSMFETRFKLFST